MDIVEVVGDFVQLKKAGSGYKALSPFTDEKTPSFNVSPSREIYKCFSTGKGGDAISFVMEYDGLSYIEAIKYLAQKYGIEIAEEEQTDEQLQAQNERESLFIALNFAAEYFQNTLKNTDEGNSIGQSYFKERGISEDAIQKFGLGYSLDEWGGFTDTALKKGYSLEILEKAGLTIRKEDKKYDRFRGRIIFPIHNVTGKVIGFGARTLQQDKKSPKYVNSPETEVYHKSHILYGIAQAKRAIRDADNCYLVEGYTDVISLYMSDMENVVASSGTALTEEQIKLISRYTQNITVLYDGDKAGLKASLRGIDMILERGMNVRVVMFPDGEDPDSYAKKLGTTAFQEYITEHTTDFIRFKAELLSEDAANDPIKKAGMIKEIVESISIIPDPVQRSVYIKETSSLLEISESVLLAEQNKFLLHKRKETSQKAERDTEQQFGLEEMVRAEKEEASQLDQSQIVTIQEKESVRMLITYGLHEWEDAQVHEFILSELDEVEFETPIYKEILDIYRDRLSKGEVVSPEYFIHHAPKNVADEVVNMITERYMLSNEWEDKYEIIIPDEEAVLNNMVMGNILRLKLRVVQKMVSGKMDDMRDVSGSHEKEDEILKSLSALKKVEMHLADQLGIVLS
jgi:DNA primase